MVLGLMIGGEVVFYLRDWGKYGERVQFFQGQGEKDKGYEEEYDGVEID